MTAGRKVNTGSVHWNTPPKYVDAVTKVFGVIELDPCSNDSSIVNATTELTSGGLDYNWDLHKRIYVNPPYGRGIYDWLEKCSTAKNEVIALIPVATNTRHWKDFVFNATVICFLSDTRLKFMINGSTNNKGASMACAMVYWGERGDIFTAVMADYGRCVKAI